MGRGVPVPEAHLGVAAPGPWLLAGMLVAHRGALGAQAKRGPVAGAAGLSAVAQPTRGACWAWPCHFTSFVDFSPPLALFVRGVGLEGEQLWLRGLSPPWWCAHRQSSDLRKPGHLPAVPLLSL